MLLNISPKADGTIPQEQKDILLAMGAWFRKYGEAVYSTRAWEKYGEGPTKMGAAHGVMLGPIAGTAKDIRFTRSKDNTTLYAIFLGWEKDQKEIKIASLSSDRISLKSLRSVNLISSEAGKYLSLAYKQNTDGLIISLPERSFDELAYVLKLGFDGIIPAIDNYADIDCAPHYYIIPNSNEGDLVLGSDLTLSAERKDITNQWKLESIGKGFYKILNRADNKNAFECSISNNELTVSYFSGKENQLWKIQYAHDGLYKITNKQFHNVVLSVSTPFSEGSKAGLLNSKDGSINWGLVEVCETEQKAFKPHTIPGTIEAEDFDIGCPGDAYYDRDIINEGGQYRQGGVDIEKCNAGGYNVGWAHIGDWMAYTVTIDKSATYQVSFYLASSYDSGKMHLECDGVDITGIISIPNTDGFQNWEVVKTKIKLDAGKHLLKLVVDGDLFNIDKMIFENSNK